MADTKLKAASLPTKAASPAGKIASTVKKSDAKTTKSSGAVDTGARLRVAYNATFAKELLKELELGNAHQAPKLEKIIVNCGLGKAKDDKKIMEIATNTLRKITGQQPVETIAKNSIAGFKLREGNKVGLKVTLRGDKMYEFADRLISVVLPRLRDFHGVNAKAFDKQGNYSLGMVDQSVFPELPFEETTTPHGLQVVFVIKCEQSAHARALLEKFGMPFEKEPK
jgi:large subunit ribosomal protein L5